MTYTLEYAIKGCPQASPKRVLTYELSEICKTEAILEVTVADANEKTYIFYNPIIKTNSRLEIEGRSILVNNVFEAKHDAFAYISTTVDENSRETIAPGTFLAVTKVERRTDKADSFAFTLDSCQLATEDTAAE